MSISCWNRVEIDIPVESRILFGQPVHWQKARCSEWRHSGLTETNCPRVKHRSDWRSWILTFAGVPLVDSFSLWEKVRMRVGAIPISQRK